MGGHDGSIFTLQFLGGALLLFLDTWALERTGMWLALRAPTQMRAALGTLGRIMVPLWLGLFFMFFFATAAGKSGDLIYALFWAWFGLGVAVDLAVGFSAQKKLAMGIRFRLCQAGQ
jgi:hypothetical protein